MTIKYIVWIQIEECEMDGDHYDTIATVGEPRQVGRFRTEQLAYEQVEYLLDQTNAPHLPEKTEKNDG